MFQVDEKVIADNRTLITIQDTKENINPITKNGTLNYTMDNNNLWLTSPKIRQAYIKKADYTSLYDRVLLARNGINIDGSFIFDEDQVFAKNVEVKQNLVVRGDFLVEGNSSVIDTPKLTIEDNIIELNRNETSAGITLNKAGLGLNRGTKPFARYLYNEATKAFVLDTNTSIDGDVNDTTWVMQAHTEANGSNIAGEVRVKEKLTVPVGNITNNLTVANTTTSRILNILETSTFGGAATFNSTATIAGVLTAKNNAIIEKLLNVKGAATFDSTVLIKNTLTVNETSTFHKKSTFNDAIDVTSIGDECAIFRKNVSMNANAGITGVLTVTGNGNFLSSINVADQVSADNAVIKRMLTASLATIDTLTVNRALSVTGPSVFNGDVTVSGQNFNVTATSSLTGATTITGTLGVTEDTTLSKNLIVNQNLTVKGTASITGATNIIGDLTANNLTSRNNISILAGNGNGLKFWNDDSYKIYMSATTDTTGGYVTGAASSDYNMYLKMSGGNNRGFVFKNDTRNIAQLEGSGIFRTTGHMFANGSQVLRQADEGHGNGIDADTLDGLHKTDYVLRDGSQAMTGDLQMASYKIKFADNDDYISYNDSNATIGTQTYNGKFDFVADGAIASSIVEAGSFKAGNIGISGKDDTLVGIKVINGAFGTIAKSTDEWLRINDDVSHTNGVYFGTSLIRTDGSLQVGASNGLIVNATSMKYKNYDVVTTAGSTMLGDIRMAKSKLHFNASADMTGTAGTSTTDNAYIYGEHDENLETSRLVLEVADNTDDAIVLRTSNAAEKKDSVKVSFNKIIFSDNPYYGLNRLLHTGDMGSGNALDADTVDGKHYIDLQNEFVNVTGDTMSGKLTMNNEIIMAADKKILFNGLATSYIRAGGTTNNDVVISSTGNIYFRPNGDDTSKNMILNTDGTLSVLGSPVLRQADEGHGKGIDADTLDGKHWSDLTTQFVDVAGDVMTGPLTIRGTTPFYQLTDTAASSTGYFTTRNDAICIEAGYIGMVANRDNGALIMSGLSGNSLKSFKVLVSDMNAATINNSKILTVADEGHTKGIDADTVDGKHATDFATSTHNHDTAYVKRTEVDLRDKYKIQYNSTSGTLDFMFMG